MASYYYLLSSLPMLRSDGEIPFEYDTFLSMCKSAVSSSKYAILENLTLSSAEGPLLSEWSKFYTIFKQELTAQRNQRLGRQVSFSYQKDETMSKTIAAAMNHKNPLEAEKVLLALQFEILDGLIGTHYFDDYALMGYALKLKLLERKNVFDQKKGKAELGRILHGLQQQILIGEQE